MYAKWIKDVHGEQQCLVSWPATLIVSTAVGPSCPLVLCQEGDIHTSGGKCINYFYKYHV